MSNDDVVDNVNEVNIVKTKKDRSRESGSIYSSYQTLDDKENKTHHCRAQVYVRGKRLTKSFTNEDDARAWIIEKLKSKDHKKKVVEAQAMTFFDLAVSFIDYKRNREEDPVREKTLYGYRETINRHLLPFFEYEKIVDIDKQMIMEFFESKRKEFRDKVTENKRKGIKKHISGKRSIQYMYVVLAEIFKYAVLVEDLLLYNPLSGVKKPTYSPDEKTILTNDEVMTLLISIEHSRYKYIYYVLFSTGMRMSELLALRWKNIYFDKSIIFVDESLSYIPNRKKEEGADSDIVISDTKSDAGNRRIPISKQVMDQLYEQYRIYLEDIKAKKRNETDDFCFLTANNEHISISNIRKDFNKYLKKCNLKHISLHEIRHTTISNLLRDGIVSIEKARIFAGHSRASTTMDIYVHDELDNLIADRLAEKILPVSVPPQTVSTPPVTPVMHKINTKSANKKGAKI